MPAMTAMREPDTQTEQPMSSTEMQPRQALRPHGQTDGHEERHDEIRAGGVEVPVVHVHAFGQKEPD